MFGVLCKIPTAHDAYASTNKTKIVLNRGGALFLPSADAPLVYVHAWTLGCFHSLISTQTFSRALTASVDNCAKIKECPFQWRNQ